MNMLSRFLTIATAIIFGLVFSLQASANTNARVAAGTQELALLAQQAKSGWINEVRFTPESRHPGIRTIKKNLGLSQITP